VDDTRVVVEILRRTGGGSCVEGGKAREKSGKSRHLRCPTRPPLPHAALPARCPPAGTTEHHRRTAFPGRRAPSSPPPAAVSNPRYRSADGCHVGTQGWWVTAWKGRPTTGLTRGCATLDRRKGAWHLAAVKALVAASTIRAGAFLRCDGGLDAEWQSGSRQFQFQESRLSVAESVNSPTASADGKASQIRLQYRFSSSEHLFTADLQATIYGFLKDFRLPWCSKSPPCLSGID